MNRLKIFVSSTCYDLSEIRTKLFDFILDTGHQPILSEYNSFPINPDDNTIENCISNVRSADLLILVLGSRYGYTMESGKSITNTEYLYAKENEIPIYVFTSKSLVELLSVWEKDKNKDFSENVDSNKLFEFVDEVRSKNQKWCFNFEEIDEITETLKIQLSHLFKQALDIRKKYRISDHPDFYQYISAKAINLLFEKDLLYEARFFNQVLMDELRKYESLKMDLEYKILTNCTRKVSDIQELLSWMNVDFETMMYLINSMNNLFTEFKKFYGEPGVPSDLKGLYYVACSIARLYKDMIQWSINMKSVKVEDDFILVRDSLSDFMIMALEQIWSYPKITLKAIDDGIKRYKETEEQVSLSAVLTLKMDEKVTDIFHSEIERLNKKLLRGF